MACTICLSGKFIEINLSFFFFLFSNIYKSVKQRETVVFFYKIEVFLLLPVFSKTSVIIQTIKLKNNS